MGDRTTVNITVRRRDVPLVERLMEYSAEETWDEGTGACLIWHDVNYGGGDVWEALVAARIPFHGWHGEGGCFCARLYAYPGCGDLADCAALGGEGLAPAVECDPETGEPHAEQIAAARAWAKAQAQAVAIFEQGDKWTVSYGSTPVSKVGI